MTQWINGKILKINKWNNFLFSIIVKAKINTFIAGQFAKLAVINENGKKIQRAYSYVNEPNNNNLEFYIVLIPKGKLTNYLYRLKPQDNILINKNSFGFFTIQEINNCDILWMIASGTGIGPFLSILQEGKWKSKFKKIILIHSVKHMQDLIYLPLINSLTQKYYNKIHFKAILSQQKTEQFLYGRVTTLLKNNILEQHIGININPTTSHVMICGNPNMVKDTKLILQQIKNLRTNLKKKPGHITTENYW